MYYNSNSNDYYNSYKKELAELEAYRKEESIHKIIKLILSVLALILLGIATFYLYKYYNPMLKKEQVSTQNQALPAIIIREDELPQSIQLRESDMQTTKNIQRNATDTTKQSKLISNMSEQDIARIVKVIMTQINNQNELPLEAQLKAIAHKNFETKSLEQTNHYNKVVLTKNAMTEVQNASLLELSEKLNSIICEPSTKNSNYTQSIQKEVAFRQNEMRIIIVKRGDTLSKIAQKAYGSPDDYPKIFVANPEIIKNPNQIFIGQRLRIPS
ncbi:MAG: Ferric siderophore transport system, periplasmic binding protein TonB [uncultured Sulfurovum sp.]|uniref:Ferric siderophore transport system, periplasmic binding protein TonB n=1 Tax=uncultured Sulfurovum sp. TaxID=269237 RepID=A0A6S6TWK0_9BACT|nr:MAG: Ferric siderophore transport system, periplasmic binding protein TonB [uncultured Sulfurovum sp.]